MYSVNVAGGDAPSHVGRHDESFGRHVCATHTAMLTHAGSLGQLVGLPQQLAATHVAHDDAAALKIWLAPAQVPPSPTIAVPLSVGLPPSGCGEAPPPGTAPPQARVGVDTQVPSCGGLGLEDEHATSAASAPARAGAASRAS
jgi:hypothetical protein